MAIGVTDERQERSIADERSIDEPRVMHLSLSLSLSLCEYAPSARQMRAAADDPLKPGKGLWTQRIASDNSSASNALSRERMYPVNWRVLSR